LGRKTQSTTDARRPFLLVYSFALPSPANLSPPPPPFRFFFSFVFGPRELAAISWFAQAEMDFVRGEPGIKFKWKLDGVPGEGTALRRGVFESSWTGRRSAPENGVGFPKVSRHICGGERVDARGVPSYSLPGASARRVRPPAGVVHTHTASPRSFLFPLCYPSVRPPLK